MIFGIASRRIANSRSWVTSTKWGQASSAKTDMAEEKMEMNAR